MNHRQSILEWIINIGKYVVIIVLILFFVRKSQDFYQMGYAIFAQEGVDEPGAGRIIAVEITPGMSASDVGDMLEEKGLIADATIFPIQERLSNYHDKIQPGIYELSTEMTTEEILEAISPETEEGEGVSE